MSDAQSSVRSVTAEQASFQMDVGPNGAVAAAAAKRAPAKRTPFWRRFTKVWIHVGSHVDPVMSADEDTLTIAVEPDPSTAALIPRHPRLTVLVAAVGNASAVAEFHRYNLGLSSSLGVAQEHMLPFFDGSHKMDGVLVPVVPLEDVLAAVPADMDIQLLVSDMQGMDFHAVSSAPRAALARVGYLVAETNCAGAHKPSYDGLANDVQAQWWPYMQALGVFQLQPHAFMPDNTPVVVCKTYGETDLVWRNRARPSGFMLRSLPLLKGEEEVDLTHAFTGLHRLVDPGSRFVIVPWASFAQSGASMQDSAELED